jgi:hypothetical protein
MDSDVKSYTRRKILKSAGVGAAGLFAAPMLVSTAFASPSRVTAGGKKCVSLALNGNQSATGLGPCDWGDSAARPCPCHMGGFVGPPCDNADQGNCFCFIDVKGCAQCVDVSTLGAACTKNSQCPPGWKCVYTCLDACPGGVGCCDTCTGNSAPSQGPSGKGLVCLGPCTLSGAGMGAAARARALKLVKAGA